MEYISVKKELVTMLPEIKSFFAKGYSTIEVFNELKKYGRIKCSQASFYRFVKKYVDFSQIDEAIKSTEGKRKSSLVSNNFT